VIGRVLWQIAETLTPVMLLAGSSFYAGYERGQRKRVEKVEQQLDAIEAKLRAADGVPSTQEKK